MLEKKKPLGSCNKNDWLLGCNYCWLFVCEAGNRCHLLVAIVQQGTPLSCIKNEWFNCESVDRETCQHMIHRERVRLFLSASPELLRVSVFCCGVILLYLCLYYGSLPSCIQRGIHENSFSWYQWYRYKYEQGGETSWQTRALWHPRKPPPLAEIIPHGSRTKSSGKWFIFFVVTGGIL